MVPIGKGLGRSDNPWHGTGEAGFATARQLLADRRDHAPLLCVAVTGDSGPAAMSRPMLARLSGPLIVLVGVMVTLPSMLGAEYDVVQNIGQGWTIAIGAAGTIAVVLTLAWPDARWARRIVLGLAAFLVLYGGLVGLWSLTVATGRPVPTDDLPYLLGLPVIAGIGGIVTIVTTWRLRSQEPRP